MPDVNQVVELRSPSNPRLLQRAAVDSGVGADLHVVFNQQRPLLRKLGVSAGLLIAHIAKAIRAQHHSRMDDNAIPQRGSRIEHGARINAAVLADAHARADDRASIDARSSTDLHVLANHCTRPNTHAFVQLHMCANDRRRMHAGCRQRSRKQLGCPRKPQPRLFGLHDALPLRKIWAATSLQHNHTRFAGQRLGSRGRILGKDQFRASGQFDGVYAVDRPLRVSRNQFAAKSFNQFAQLHASLLSKSPPRPPGASSISGESTATGQDSAESTFRGRWCTVA